MSSRNPITENHYSSYPSRPWSVRHPDGYNKFLHLQHTRPSSLGWFKMIPSTAMQVFMSAQFKRSLSISEVRRLQMLWEPLVGRHAEMNSTTKTRMQTQLLHFLAVGIVLDNRNECSWRLPLVMEQNAQNGWCGFILNSLMHSTCLGRLVWNFRPNCWLNWFFQCYWILSLITQLNLEIQKTTDCLLKN